MSAGHDHRTRPEPLTGPLAIVLPGVVATIVVATALGVWAYWPGDQQELTVSGDPVYAFELVDGTVRSVEQGPCPGTPEAAEATCDLVRIEVTSGPTAAERGEDPTIATLQQVPNAPAGQARAGDKVVLGYSAQAEEGFQYYFADYQRRSPLFWLAVLFAVAVILLGRWQGVRALIALGISLVVIIAFILPAILAGSPPVVVALLGASVVAFVALYLTHGLNHRTTVAFLGTMASLALTGALAAAFLQLTRVTGLATEEAAYLQTFSAQIDLKGLLLAGIVIGTLGVLDDVTVTQVAAVEELHRAQPEAPGTDVWRGAMRIGRDHIGSTVNTLVLAYAGASLPLLLLFTQTSQSLTDVLNGEIVAVEIIRTLVGSIGLVASVPITTALAVWVVRHEPQRPAVPDALPDDPAAPLRDAGPVEEDPAGEGPGATGAAWEDFAPEPHEGDI
jgi:uncharacterized membrane protein